MEVLLESADSHFFMFPTVSLSLRPLGCFHKSYIGFKYSLEGYQLCLEEKQQTFYGPSMWKGLQSPSQMLFPPSPICDISMVPYFMQSNDIPILVDIWV